MGALHPHFYLSYLTLSSEPDLASPMTRPSCKDYFAILFQAALNWL
jgi:hypothetical protein